MLYSSLLLVTGFAFQGASAQTVANTATPPAAVTPAAVTQEMRCDILMARKMYRDAVDCFKPGADTSAVWANKMGIAYHQLADLANAEKYYQRAIKLDPKYPEAVNNLGAVYYARKSYRKAVSEYRKALQLRPDSAAFLANLGTAYFARKQYQLATDAYNQALRLDPEVLERRSTQGTAVQDLTVEERARLHYYFAKTYSATGATELALQYIRKCLEEGFKDRQRFLKEPAFAVLRDDPQFKELMTTEPKVL